MAPQPHSPWPRQPQGHVSQVGGPSGGSLFSLFCCSPREGAPWLGLGPKQWWEFGLFWAQAAPQVQSTFSVSCASGVTVSRLVQAVGHGFVILRHLSAPPVELAGGSQRHSCYQRHCLRSGMKKRHPGFSPPALASPSTSLWLTPARSCRSKWDLGSVLL